MTRVPELTFPNDFHLNPELYNPHSLISLFVFLQVQVILPAAGAKLLEVLIGSLANSHNRTGELYLVRYSNHKFHSALKIKVISESSISSSLVVFSSTFRPVNMGRD